MSSSVGALGQEMICHPSFCSFFFSFFFLFVHFFFFFFSFSFFFSCLFFSLFFLLVRFFFSPLFLFFFFYLLSFSFSLQKRAPSDVVGTCVGGVFASQQRSAHAKPCQPRYSSVQTLVQTERANPSNRGQELWRFAASHGSALAGCHLQFLPTWCFKPNRCQVCPRKSEANQMKTMVLTVQGVHDHGRHFGMSLLDHP